MFKITDHFPMKVYILCDLCKERIEDLQEAQVFYDPKIAENMEVYPGDTYPGISIVHGGNCSDKVQNVLCMIGTMQPDEPCTLLCGLVALLRSNGVTKETFLKAWDETFS